MFPISSFRTFCHKFSMQKRNISSFLQELKINWIIISIAMAEFWSWKELRVLTFTDTFYFASSIMEDRTSMLISQYYFKVHKSRAHLEPGQASRVGVGQTFMALVFAKAVNWLACEICGECIKLALHWFFRHSTAQRVWIPRGLITLLPQTLAYMQHILRRLNIRKFYLNLISFCLWWKL